MRGVDPIVKRETEYIAAGMLVLGALMQAVFVVIGRWDVSVLLGNALSAAALVGNFFAMALGVQRAVAQEEKQAKRIMQRSNAARMLAMSAVLAVGVLLPAFNTWAVIIPVAFPRLIVAVRPALERMKPNKEGVHEPNER
jgi:hypothetical protein